MLSLHGGVVWLVRHAVGVEGLLFLLVVSRLDCLFVSVDLLVQMLLIRGGISVEVSTLVVVVLLDIHEGGGALGDPLEATQTADVSVRVDIDVLDGGRIHKIDESLLVGHLFVEHLQFLLILLDTNFDAVNQNLGIDHFLRGEGHSCLFVTQTSDGTGDRGWLSNDLCNLHFSWNKSDGVRVE